MIKNTTAFLRGQLDAFAESWQTDHYQSLACRDLEARLKLALTLYDLIQAADVRATGEIRPGEMEVYLNEFHDLYDRWFTACGDALNAIAELEANGYEVEGADRFRTLYRQVRGILSVSPAELISAINERDQGLSRPLHEVRDELRGRTNPGVH